MSRAKLVSVLQDRAAIEGARIMVVDHEFSAEAVDSRLGVVAG